MPIANAVANGPSSIRAYAANLPVGTYYVRIDTVAGENNYGLTLNAIGVDRAPYVANLNNLSITVSNPSFSIDFSEPVAVGTSWLTIVCFDDTKTE